ncbi:hypothetical protein IWQ62_001378 [Dispira parvispora]|uniref:ARID domain-containing protein n=1 Tax=Dispira parvispora TaxID=1520584 RepID=A0A9W8E8L5_9FUNG|nr:hypothetical protein IWQ62_001378 [Dispira parvispora]
MTGTEPPMGASVPQNFDRGLYAFHNKQGKSVPAFPIVNGQPLTAFRLAQWVDRLGGHPKLNRDDGWGQLAQELGLPCTVEQVAALKGLYIQYVLPYVHHLKSNVPRVNSPTLTTAPTGSQPAKSAVIESATDAGTTTATQPTSEVLVGANATTGTGNPQKPPKRARVTPKRALQYSKYDPLVYDVEEYLGGLFQNRIYLALRSNLPNEVDWAFNRLLRISKHCHGNFDIRCIPGLLFAILYHLKVSTIQLVVSLDRNQPVPSVTGLTGSVNVDNSDVVSPSFFTAKERVWWERIMQVVTICHNFSELDSVTPIQVVTNPAFIGFVMWILQSNAHLDRTTNKHSASSETDWIQSIRAADQGWQLDPLELQRYWEAVLRTDARPFCTAEMLSLCLSIVETECLAVPVTQIPVMLPSTLRANVASPDRAVVVHALTCLSYLLLREAPGIDQVVNSPLLHQLTVFLLAPDMELLYLTLDFLVKYMDIHQRHMVTLLTSSEEPVLLHDLVAILISRMDEQSANLFPAPAASPKPIAPTGNSSMPTTSPVPSNAAQTSAPTPAGSSTDATGRLTTWLQTNLELAPPTPNPAGPEQPPIPALLSAGTLYEAYRAEFSKAGLNAAGSPGEESSTTTPSLLNLESFLSRLKTTFPASQTVRHPKANQLLVLHLKAKHKEFQSVPATTTPLLSPTTGSQTAEPTPTAPRLTCEWDTCDRSFAYIESQDSPAGTQPSSESPNTEATEAPAQPPNASPEESSSAPLPSRSVAITRLLVHTLRDHLPSLGTVGSTAPPTFFRCQWKHCSYTYTFRPTDRPALRVVAHLKTHLVPNVPLSPPAPSPSERDTSEVSSLQPSLIPAFWGNLDPQTITQRRQQILMKVLLFLRALVKNPLTRSVLIPYGAKFTQLSIDYPPMCRDLLTLLVALDGKE